MEKILTLPQTENGYMKYLATGNEFVSIPAITENAEIESLNIILDRTNSLIDFTGHYLIKPIIWIDNQFLVLKPGKARYENSWIPVFEYEEAGVKAIIRVIAPKGYKGFAYEITVKNTTAAEMEIKCGVEGSWTSSSATVFHTQKLSAEKDVFLHQWTNSIVFELKNNITLAALAISGDCGCELSYNNAAMSYIVANITKLESGQERSFYYYYSINIEQDGAGTTNIDLRRRGGKILYNEEFRWLNERRIQSGNKVLEDKANRNLFFSYFYSLGYTLDTEEQVLLTSKSPKYYVSAAFWGRDSLLWSFPAICMLDKKEARKMLLTCFTKYLKNAGIHSLYTSGSVLYPGFELDELAAYAVALSEYIEWTNDKGIMTEDKIAHGLIYLLEQLEKWYSPEYGLYGTELDPSDDPVTYPYLIYDNILVWKALAFLSEYGYVEQNEADVLKINIEKYGIIEGPYGKMYAWSTDCLGHHEIYDDPPGSLVLLAYYGFCGKDDEIYLNTVKWIYSEHNEYLYNSGKFSSTGCIHTPYPWLMSICNYLLVFNDESRLRMIEELELDNGFACESFDSDTGILKTGGAFASCAGFFGYALARALK